MGVGRIEQQHAPEARAPAGGQIPVLALDVMDDSRAWPGEQRRNDKADALAGAGRRETEHMLRPFVTQVTARQASKHNAILAEQTRRAHLVRRRPARRAVGDDAFGFARPRDRHGDRRRDRGEAAGRGDGGAFDEDLWRIGVEMIPPPKEGRRHINWQCSQLEPSWPELRLKPQPPSGPLRRAPGRGEHDRKDDEDCAPEDSRRRHGYQLLSGFV